MQNPAPSSAPLVYHYLICGKIMVGSLRRQYDKHTPSDSLSGSRSLHATSKFIHEHDDAMIKDCDEDLNALLILAGLFATILTAFLAGSTGWLQQDNTQVTADLLLQISAQLADAAQAEIAQLPTFEATTTDIAINIMWFLSLVLSLASALFGMIVKRWLREYTAWQTESLPQAICLRQVRYKAFLRWKVPLIVALLPGLLEVALVLFMAGIVAMLWTLNSLLAAIISAASAALLVIAFSAVLIPIFFHNCPYRSPGGWVCVLAWGYISRFYYRTLWAAGLISRAFLHDQLSRRRTSHDWKQRDLHLNFADESGPHADSETTKLIHLIDAIVWTYQRRQDDALLDGLSYHADPNADSSIRSQLRLPLHAACRVLGVPVEKFFEFLRRQYALHLSPDGSARFTLCLSDTWDALHPWSSKDGNTSLQVLGHFLLAELKEATTAFQSSDAPQSALSDATAFVEALCFLYHISKAPSARTLKGAFATFLEDVYRNSSRDGDSMSSAAIPNFRTIAIEILRKMRSARAHGDNISGHTRGTRLGLQTFKDHARLAIEVFHESSDYSNEESRHLFVTLSNLAIQRCDSWRVLCYDHDDLQSLLQCMEAAARISLERSITNCGHYSGLPWVASLSKAAASHAGLHTCIPLSFLRTLSTGVAQGLFIGKHMQRQLRGLKARCACRDTMSIPPDTPLQDPFGTGASTPKTLVAPSLSTPQVSRDSTSRTPLLASASSDSLVGGVISDMPLSSSPTSLTTPLAKNFS
ncbi:hypothetical protein PsYK624_095410 [Phanerochaete sordida]|uniref:DUF6535 domain-containing protein n=1 Tax=Phanerochaete sordida TaxID=48140 RepID=A0A9P3GCU3_9APHY|nr:hypothetical protein PsYK624_095410 [Phanerochaete sordida]